MRPSGLFADGKAWASVPRKKRGHYTGDCRSDINRWPSDTAIQEMEGSNAKQT